MARKRKYKYLVCDFETTVYEGQTRTDVWASACVEIYTEDVVIHHSIAETWQYFKSLKCNIIAYYHNLKFDGSFWLDYLLNVLKFKQASYQIGSEEYDVRFTDKNKMPTNSIAYSISDLGQWYTLTIKTKDYIIELRDSLKLLPFSISRIGKSFATKHKKLEMEYEGFRYPGCTITDKEKEYIANDVLVAKEALEIMFSEGHEKLTIGACCLSEYKAIISKDTYNVYFPDLTQTWINPSHHEYDNADAWIRKTYKGGWVYVVPEKANVVYHKGLTADVNSLYPSVMHSDSGSVYPVGQPKFWVGEEIPEEALRDDFYFFVHVKTRFYVKDNYLPFVQIKGNYLYKSTEILDTSDVYIKSLGKKVPYYTDFDGNIKDTRVDLYFTQTEYILFLEHYNVIDFEIIDGCYFVGKKGIFDEYIDKYAEIKMSSKGAKRELAKLFLNNLYGKLASSTDSSFKYAYIKEDGSIGFVGVTANEKQAGHIATGSAITGYARNFTIRHAQKNYHGPEKPGFCYADTDSIHCNDISPKELIDIKTHATKFNHWKVESLWDEAIFVRPKTYIEHVTHEDLEAVEPYYNVKCAGMPDRCKQQFVKSMQGVNLRTHNDYEYYMSLKKQQRNFILKRRTIKDFKVGLKISGKLVPKRIPGGVLLTETDYELR